MSVLRRCSIEIAVGSVLAAVSVAYAATQVVDSWNPPTTDELRITMAKGGGASPPDTSDTVTQMLVNGRDAWNICDPAHVGMPALTGGPNPDWSVRYVPWNEWSNSAKNGCGVACGCADYSSSVSGTIYLDRDRLGDSSQGCLGSQRIITHELGHILGLKNSSCAGHIMNNSSSIHGDECIQAANNFETTWERDNKDENPCYPEPTCETPLVLDIDGGGILTSSADLYGVDFDIDGDGVRERIGWLGGSNHDAFLWMDLNNNRRVDGGQELFGSASSDPRGTPFGAKNGFEVLALYDRPEFGGNSDGRIDNDDAIWSRLWLWEDTDRDGQSSSREIKPIQRYGIVSVDTSYTEIHEVDGAHNLRVARGRFWIMERGLLEARTVDDIAFDLVQ